MPEWGPVMPTAAAPRLPETTREGAAAVYVPSCINRMFGTSRQGNGGAPELSVVDALVTVCREGPRTRDVGGTATTEQFTEAVLDSLTQEEAWTATS